MIPDHVLASIEQRTGQDFARGAARRVRADHCRRCGRLVLRGLDADLLAGLAVVDPVGLSQLGEQVAIAAGLETFTLAPAGMAGLNLDDRDPWRRRRPPEAHRRANVVPEHSCPRRWLLEPLTASWRLPGGGVATPAAADAPPPF